MHFVCEVVSTILHVIFCFRPFSFALTKRALGDPTGKTILDFSFTLASGTSQHLILRWHLCVVLTLCPVKSIIVLAHNKVWQT